MALILSFIALCFIHSKLVTRSRKCGNSKDMHDFIDFLSLIVKLGQFCNRLVFSFERSNMVG